MFEKFTEGAIKVIMLAQEEAKRLGHNFVDAEQIMLGLIGEGGGVAARSLKSSGVRLKDARECVELAIGRGNTFAPLPWYLRWADCFREMPFKPRAKKILELSWDEARQLNDTFVATEHLLLALIHEEQESYKVEGTQGVAIQTLQNLGLDLKLLETKVRELTEQRRHPPADVI